MKPTGSLKLVSQLLDLPIIDKDGNYCGIVDDLELSGSAGKATELSALLVGPGAYKGRLPSWTMAAVRWIAGDRVTRVPVAEIETINSAVHVKTAAASLGLHKSEDAARRWIPRAGAM